MPPARAASGVTAPASARILRLARVSRWVMLMAADPHRQASTLSPTAPIPGRGLPADAIELIPTPQIRLARACGLFATSLAAAGTLAIGPAVVIARIAAGVPIVVTWGAEPAPAATARDAAGTRVRQLLLTRPRYALTAHEPLLVAGAAGAPRLRPQGSALRSPGRPAPMELGAARLAARRGGRRSTGESTVLARRQRPPPAARRQTPGSSLTLIAHASAASPLYGWCGPIFSSSRI